LIVQEIRDILGENIQFFNGAPRLAKHLYEVLEENDLLENNNGYIEFYDSKNSEKKKERFFNIIKK
jgi:glutamate racemase